MLQLITIFYKCPRNLKQIKYNTKKFKFKHNFISLFVKFYSKKYVRIDCISNINQADHHIDLIAFV